MKHGANTAIALIVIVLLAGGIGYWVGKRPIGSHEAAVAGGSAANSDKPERKILYYRNPMGLPDTSPVPKKDPMGMDYIPVRAGEDESEPGAANQIKISTEKIQKLGVRTEAASIKAIDNVVHAAGRIEPDERRVFVIAPKFEGYVERLHVNATGQPVAKGQPLFEVYSPELVSAQREYAIAAQGVQSLASADPEARSGMQQLADSSLLRLKNWDISAEQIKALTKSAEAKRSVTMRSPVAGIVTEKKAVQGMRFMPGEMLYQVTDLSSIWVLADVFEQDIGLLARGARAKVKINAYPDKEFTGVVTYVYPTLKAETRTVQVRIELLNPGQLLKPGMFANVEMAAAAKSKGVTVPVSAVIDSGTRRIVLVQAKEGRFEPREVKLGARSNEYIEVLDGVRDGELVVVSANFLIDAESNLKAAVGGFGHAAHGGGAGAQASPSTPANKGASGTGHKGEGTVDSIDVEAGKVSIAHGPVSTLKWPAMTMAFSVANEALLKNITVGAKVAFEFVERKPGEWVITTIGPDSESKRSAGPAATDPHAGH